MVCGHTAKHFHTLYGHFELAGVTVRFMRPSYTFEEGQNGTLCVDVIGVTDVAISVGVSTAPVNAEGEGFLLLTQCAYQSG